MKIFHDMHMEMIDRVNNSRTEEEWWRHYFLLQAWRDGARATGAEIDLMEANCEQMRRLGRKREDIAMCCGVFTDWKPESK